MNAPDDRMRSASRRRAWVPLVAFTVRRLGWFLVGAGTVASPAPTLGQALVTSVSKAPAAWQAYGQMVQRAMQKWLTVDEGAVKGFQTSVLDRPKQAVPLSPSAVANVWVSASGKIEKVDFEGLDHSAGGRLSAVLIGRDIGLRPPPDMLQPLRLKLSLGDKT